MCEWNKGAMDGGSTRQGKGLRESRKEDGGGRRGNAKNEVK